MSQPETPPNTPPKQHAQQNRKRDPAVAMPEEPPSGEERFANQMQQATTREVIRCDTCRWGRDKSMGGWRRCRRLPPTPRFVGKIPYGDAMAVDAEAMWPKVADKDYCGMGEA